MAPDAELKRARRALLSVTDKSGLTALAQGMLAHGYELIASGGTAAHLRAQGLAVTDVSELTSFPEILGGRVKTLHPLVHAGILARDETDLASVAGLGVLGIDVVCVNLYRFAVAAAGGVDESELIEAIDIGGPTLLRAAAKSHERVTVLPSPTFYDEFLAELAAEGGGTSPAFRRRLAIEAFRLTAGYDEAIATELAARAGGTVPERFATGAAALRGEAPDPRTQARAIVLRYGENPHQGAWLTIGATAERDLASCGLRQLGGKELSFNNLVDLVAALKLVGDFAPSSCCGIVKHTNPCGFAVGEPAPALERALRCDPVSAFGGVFAFTADIDVAVAELLRQRFLEIVAAPAFSEEALRVLRRKKNVRLITCDLSRFRAATRESLRGFGWLVLHQDEDEGFPELESWRLAAGSSPAADVAAALRLAWRVCKHVKSNAIVLADGEGTLGIGAGQMSRVDSVRLAILKAHDQALELAGAVAASDGFFPFPDGIEKLAAAGVRHVVAPGGSIRDEEVAARAAELGVSLLLTDRRHFRH
jgi:phosphoribosylaminoimidazolecarboxamide formyltransferase/IMP cyclohydrolase